jgi:hypothetical protein
VRKPSACFATSRTVASLVSSCWFWLTAVLVTLDWWSRRGLAAYLDQYAAPAGVAPGTLLALAVNGRIGMVVKLAPEGSARALRLADMLPGSSFVAGQPAGGPCGGGDRAAPPAPAGG